MSVQLPTDSEVRFFHRAALNTKDKRAGAAATLILARSFTIPMLLALRRGDLDPVELRLHARSGRGRSQAMSVTAWIAEQLLAIPVSTTEAKFFVKKAAAELPLPKLLRQVFERAMLGRYTVPSFTLWSRLQSRTTRDSIATGTGTPQPSSDISDTLNPFLNKVWYNGEEWERGTFFVSGVGPSGSTPGPQWRRPPGSYSGV
jgi:hypothetical protein